MIKIAVESTGAVASVAVGKDGIVIGSEECTEKKRHSETLLPLLDDLLVRYGYSIKDVDAFLVDVGPGSFTGVRIGVASVNAIALTMGKPVVGITSLDALYAHAGCPENAVVMIDAGGGRVFAAEYHGGERAGEPTAGTRERIMASAAAETSIIDGGIPHAEDLIRAERFGMCSSSAKPLYIVPSQAERMFAARASREGKGSL